MRGDQTRNRLAGTLTDKRQVLGDALQIFSGCKVQTKLIATRQTVDQKIVVHFEPYLSLQFCNMIFGAELVENDQRLLVRIQMSGDKQRSFDARLDKLIFTAIPLRLLRLRHFVEHNMQSPVDYAVNG